MTMRQIFQINVHEVLRSKAPKLYPKIPDFLINAFTKLIYLDKVNAFLHRNSTFTGVDLMEKFLEETNIQFRIKGEENIPGFDEKCIFCSNHPLGGLDGVTLSVILGQKYDKRIRYLVNDILYFIQPLQNIFVPINKHGAQGRNAARAINEAFASENQIITFPAGLCSRKTKGKISDLEWKKMFISKAIEYKRNIVPIYFEAKNSNLFYTVANIRKKLCMKINIEMLLLPREMFIARNSIFTVYFGKPIPWQTFDASQTPQQWANWLKQEVYCMVKC
ncbi:MAG: 1-acyl-sn-glycerol-3-phosphate acyltransferase [Dysgonamonadaceae bacterium]|jgi:putative hemolysin|nr:1-acyl-sn-glycerol-3-phosphate acyltransferase [Dysgonamonadaceae bacterium]